ncbi:hypothetical protein CIW82_16055 [Acetobacter tropicalis]|uniref:Uncharacterized protein n=1 Tax=Acetobacter tropicalis TaxID=104102 RepID=A0A291PKM8_9PROT|nr:hypothetical protein CIW82_16055 [Acetobacter tropicalis]
MTGSASTGASAAVSETSAPVSAGTSEAAAVTVLRLRVVVLRGRAGVFAVNMLSGMLQSFT